MNPLDLWGLWGEEKPHQPTIQETFEAGLRVGIDHNFEDIKAWRERQFGQTLNELLFDFDGWAREAIEHALDRDFVHFMGNQDRIDNLAKVARICRA